MKIAIPFVFADKELDQIARALPASASAHRLSLLPNVLREWAENYLPEYIDLANSRSSTLEQTKRLAKVGLAAGVLQKAIATVIEADDLSLIALRWHARPTQRATGSSILSKLSLTLLRWLPPFRSE